jgi:hypothetical protein
MTFLLVVHGLTLDDYCIDSAVAIQAMLAKKGCYNMNLLLYLSNHHLESVCTAERRWRPYPFWR